MATLTDRLRRGRDARGSELIELALVLPILLVVLAGIVDFGFLFQRYEVITNAAREGARVAVLPNYAAADAQARVQNYLSVNGLGSAPAPVVEYTTEPLTGGRSIRVVTVTVTYPTTLQYLGSLGRLVGGGDYGTVTLRAASSMRLETAGTGS
jgi:Flp pilus assembly protein TadG